MSLKAFAEAAILRLGAASWRRRRFAGRTLVLSYHNVVPDDLAGYGDASLQIPISRFRAHMDAIADTASVVSLDAAVRRNERNVRPSVVVTFDDAYRGAVSLAVGELAARGWPAIVFVPPAFVPDHTFWWDDVAQDQAGLTQQLRDRALNEFAGRDGEVRARLSVKTVSNVPAAVRCASELDLAEAVRDGLIVLGAHTWSHPNLTRLDPNTLRTELESPIAWLRERFGASVVPWMSYPYGMENKAVRTAAGDAGYVGAFRVSGGWMPDGDADPFGLPRLNVPAGLSPEGLAIRLSGFLS